MSTKGQPSIEREQSFYGKLPEAPVKKSAVPLFSGPPAEVEKKSKDKLALFLQGKGKTRKAHKRRHTRRKVKKTRSRR